MSSGKKDVRNNKVNPSTLEKHALEKNRNFDFDNVELVYKEADYNNRLFLEMLQIKQDKNWRLSTIYNNINFLQ